MRLAQTVSAPWGSHHISRVDQILPEAKSIGTLDGARYVRQENSPENMHVSRSPVAPSSSAQHRIPQFGEQDTVSLARQRSMTLSPVDPQYQEHTLVIVQVRLLSQVQISVFTPGPKCLRSVAIIHSNRSFPNRVCQTGSIPEVKLAVDITVGHVLEQAALEVPT
ncbi:hypothetical protein GLOTRDRAFT_95195 [Gloeophyllum trabeum ATCC 11539]|uniref:Uncharacterized protein n=1 Tax=Gloeophyllum trabeum (strain ATCC 11539 / FP-39264 / Madison 617) TaxID=670483 RepID=S7Q0Z6_GLOTA|nr:uncharacterized protein GLOTRDRAFT_95195 [Gloeophyllum trabeum ATCC 11539]EPQ53187.1 hypothetical protein GLOTRDRAFT_95195 [Gloeophyllum trabeum ATCC 11539]